MTTPSTPTTDATLAAKLQALGEIAWACGLSRAHLALAEEKTRRGHIEHDDGATVDLWHELREEIADIAGYGAWCKWRGLWGWRLRAVVFLAGLQWRLLATCRTRGDHGAHPSRRCAGGGLVGTQARSVGSRQRRRPGSGAELDHQKPVGAEQPDADRCGFPAWRVGAHEGGRSGMTVDRADTPRTAACSRDEA